LLAAKLRANRINGAAVPIQALWRGALARMLFAKMKAAKGEEIRLLASFVIQRIWRGFAAQKHIRKVKESSSWH
jgi:hypothetical protein